MNDFCLCSHINSITFVTQKFNSPCCPHQISRYESGKVHPTAASVRKLADALETTTDFLIEGATDALAIDRLSDRELLKQFQVIEKLEEEKKAYVMQVIGDLIRSQKLQELAAG